MKPKKRWSPCVANCAGDWSRNFGFLKKISSCDAYLSILAMASSINHLDRLHDMLPENARLLRDDWIKLKKFWQLHFGGNETAKYRKELTEWLLSEQTVEYGVTSYYAERIMERARPLQEGVKATGDFMFSPVVLSCEERLGYGENHFQAELFGAVVDTGFRYHQERKLLRVCFVFKERELTEQVTHGIISKLPSYLILTRCVAISSTRDGNYLNIAFTLEEADELEKYWEPLKEDVVATSELVFVAANFLRKHGISVEGGLSPIIGA